MNDNLKRLKPREKPELHPRLFRQLLDPFKSLAYQNQYPVEDGSCNTPNLPSARSSGRCIGHFFDNTTKKVVLVDMGRVWVNCRDSYRSVPSSVEGLLDADQPFEGEGTVRYESFSDEHRPERSEDGAESENRPGPYVIPGQSLIGWTNHQFEWSESKCARELC